MQNFNERLKILRNKNKVSQLEMSEILKVTVRQYRRYEAGQAEPSYTNLKILADYFDVSLDYLTGRTDDVSDAPLTNEHINRVDMEKKIDEIFDDLSEESKKEALKYAEFLLRKQQEDENKDMKDK